MDGNTGEKKIWWEIVDLANTVANEEHTQAQSTDPLQGRPNITVYVWEHTRWEATSGHRPTG